MEEYQAGNDQVDIVAALDSSESNLSVEEMNETYGDVGIGETVAGQATAATVSVVEFAEATVMGVAVVEH